MYCTPFAQYVKENYDETLFWYRSQLNICQNSRSLKGTFPTQSKLTSPPMVALPPSMTINFDLTAVDIESQQRSYSPEYFNRVSKTDQSPSPPNPRPSLPTLPAFPRSIDSDYGIKKLSLTNGNYSVLPTRNRYFQSDIASIQEEVASTEADRPRLSHSIHNPQVESVPSVKCISSAPKHRPGRIVEHVVASTR
jgi:hypothetical protein